MAVKRRCKSHRNRYWGKENLEAATHCVTRLRLVLKDESKVDKGALSNNALVKAVQSRPSISNCHWSGTVDEVYKHFIEETGAQEASKDEAKQAAAQRNQYNV